MVYGEILMQIVIALIIIIFAVILGFKIGKLGIDSLVDANLKQFKHVCIAAAIGLLLAIICTIFLKNIRMNLVTLIFVYIVAVPIGFLAPVFCFSTVGLRVKWNDKVGTIHRDLVYDETREETGYDLYVPARLEEGIKYSLVLYVHGGGFTSGSRKDGELWCKYMTSKGYVAASMDYTLQKKGYKSDLYLVTNQVKDCVSAIEKKCREIGYPVTEMAVTGGSAGGTLALLFAYKKANESAIPVKFVFEQAGPVYFNPVCWNAAGNLEEQAVFVTRFCGIVVDIEMIKNNEHFTYINELSPACCVKEDTVPTLCAYGSKDKMVPTCLKYWLLEALEKYHIPYNNIEYPHSNHGLYDDPGSQKEFLKKLDEYCEQYFENKI